MENVIQLDKSPSHIVGVGASAGGLEAIETLFDNMPPNTGLAFVVVQHLSPDYKSLMRELLSKHTEMPVLRIEDGMPVRANHVYLIPPKSNLKIFHGRLLLTEQQPIRGINLPIDVFFRSLAEDQGDKAIGIILSGTGSDGTRGLRAVKEAGGMAMVQTQESAKFDGMPRAAASSGFADFVLAPERMPDQLLAYVEHPYASRATRHEALLDDQDGLTRIFALLRERSKVDFTFYKPSTIIRRIERRMTVNQLADLRDYVTMLERYPGEVGLLFRELLIGVTSFFRDPEAFAVLESEILPELFRGNEQREIRFWVAGCSTGEEAYSLAMAARETMNRMGTQIDLKIFATDVDRDAIVTAGQGEYPEGIAADLPEGYQTKYFHWRDDRLQVARTIREMVVFAQHDLIRDPPFTHIDLISCRNLLIYLQPVLQSKVLEFFNFSLDARGVLFLGPSETTGELAEYFEPLHHKLKLYRSRGRSQTPTGAAIRIGEPRRRLPYPRFRGGSELMRGGNEERAIERFLQALSPELVEVAVIVNERKEVVHIIGDSSRYFQLPAGKMTNDVTKMAVKDLSIPLATGLQRVLDKREPLTYSNVRLRGSGDSRAVHLRFRPLPEKAGQQSLVALLIDGVAEKPNTSASEQVYDVSLEAEQRITDLEQELQFTRENLQATIEELETANEELQATNEELLASNEELQSTNEELQSVNEELHTVNAEYHRKIVELTELNNDMENLLASTQIGTLFVDENLEVRKFTPELASVARISDADLGRPLDHIVHDLEKTDLVVLARKVQTGASSEELEVATRDGRRYLLKCLPYEIGPRTFSGVVMSFIDITARTRAEQALRQSETFLRHASSLAKVGAWAYMPDEGEQQWSEEVFRIHDLEPGPPPSVQRGIEFYDEASRPRIREAFERLLREGEPYDLVLRIVTARGRGRWVRAIGKAEREGERTTRVVGAFQDITALREKDDALRASEHRYQKLFHSMVNGFALHRIVTDAEGKPVDYEFLELNAAFEHLTGLKRQDVVGRRATDVIPGLSESEAGWIERYGRVVDTGEPVHFEAYEPKLDRWFEVMAYRPEPGHFVTLFNDVSTRKRQESRLAQSRRMLRAQRRLAEAFLAADGERLFDDLLAAVLDATESPLGYVGYVNADGDLVSPSLTRDVWDRCQVPGKSIVFPRSEWCGLWGKSLREQRTLWANEALSPPAGHVPLQAALVVPILFESRLIGQFAVANKHGGYGEQDAQILEDLAVYVSPFLNQQIANALETP